ncbi:hypothetical protein LIER_02704 [Lithospermum erythrorhizon]|uniref:Uncharacterized protein n=1 Tax=Lithospermum erythrorhizon TaxID=34254 RepID=A0AAV3NQU9_LITER
MDLDLPLRANRPTPLTAESSLDDKREFEKWERSNHMSLMSIKRSIPEALRDVEFGGRNIVNDITFEEESDSTPIVDSGAIIDSGNFQVIIPVIVKEAYEEPHKVNVNNDPTQNEMFVPEEQPFSLRLHETKKFLSKNFEMKDRDASFVLGIQIHRDRSRGDKFSLKQCPNNSLEIKEMRKIPYASAVRSLMYAQDQI